MMTDFEKMAICAIRYTIGRRSHVVADGHQWAMEWGAKSNWVRDVIIRDLEEATERCNSGTEALGDSSDEGGWRWVLFVLQAMKEPGR